MRKNEVSGFTLVEVLVALTILVSTMALSYQSSSLSLRKQVSSEALDRLILVAEERLVLLRLSPSIPIGETRGETFGVVWKQSVTGNERRIRDVTLEMQDLKTGIIRNWQTSIQIASQ